MTEECPNCKQLTNTSFSRLVKDSCGHTKCRMCLLYEEHGCKTCDSEHRIENIGNYDCSPLPSLISSSSNADGKERIPNDDIILPLELVINKDSKEKADILQYSPTDCIGTVESYHQGDTPLAGNTNDTECNLNILQIESAKVNANTNINDENRKLEFHEKGKLRNKPLKNPDRTHISVISGNPEKYKCNICCKVFKNKKGKCYHDACITGIKPYQCKLCDRSFVKRSHYEYHERVHTGYKPFKCDICDKAFPQQNKLNRHMYSHSKEKQFSCSACNKAYSKRDDLKNHLALHNSTTTYPCKSCGKTFRVLTNLKRHIRSHTNERPYVCSQCNKSFKDKSLLLRHQRTHGKDRPYSCAHCNRVFLSKSELRRHLTIHSDEKPFSCEYCETVFRRKDNLKRHIRHHHTEDASHNNSKVQNITKDKSIKIERNKQSNPRQKSKPKKTQKVVSNLLPKSPSKVTVVYISTRDQINSRLDSKGNITPVIRTTSEMSNAVPVINGPISIKQSENITVPPKKMFTYTEPIPLAEAVDINRRIEEKLYAQNTTNRNYFFHSSSSCVDKPYATASYISRSNCNGRNTSTKTYSQNNSSGEPVSNIQNKSIYQNNPSCDFLRNTVREKQAYKLNNIEAKTAETLSDNIFQNGTIPKLINNSEDNICVLTGLKQTISKQEPTYYVPTMKKHIMQQFESEISKNHNQTNNLNLVRTPAPLDDYSNQKKHWRRRTAEILKPNN